MKKSVFCLCSLIFALGFTACSGSQQAPQNQNAAPTQQVSALANANNPNVVKAEGQMVVIPAPQPATPPAPVDTAKAPKIVLPVKKVDFGKVDPEKKITKDIIVKNTGKSLLNIESVTPS
jgi:hypothetical protein